MVNVPKLLCEQGIVFLKSTSLSLESREVYTDIIVAVPRVLSKSTNRKIRINFLVTWEASVFVTSDETITLQTRDWLKCSRNYAV